MSLIVKKIKDPDTEVDVDFEFAFYWPLVRSYIENNIHVLEQHAFLKQVVDLMELFLLWMVIFKWFKVFLHCKLCKNFFNRVNLKKKKKKNASRVKFSIKRWNALPKSNMQACLLNRKSTYHSLIPKPLSFQKFHDDKRLQVLTLRAAG